MKEIILSNGLKSKVDDEDFDELNKYQWKYVPRYNRKGGYAGRTLSPSNKIEYMHRVTISVSTNEQVDHIDGDGLNNCKDNLRKATHQQNQCNKRIPSTNTSGYKGVSWDKSRNKWCARIKVKQKQKTLGRFNSKEEAAKAYNTAAVKYFGEFANLNDI